MWRFLLFVSVAVGAAYYWWQSRDSEALRAKEAAKIVRAEKEIGIRRMLAAHQTFKFSSVVVDMSSPNGVLDFRAQIKSQETLVAAYGQVRSECSEEFAAPSCWEIAILEADGKPVELETSPEVPGDAAVDVDTNKPAEDSDAVGGTDTKEDDAKDDSVQSDDSEPAATHRVARPRINSRTGPGTSNPVVTQLLEDTELSLLETRSGWGRFQIMSGPSKGEAVWIALSLTAEL